VPRLLAARLGVLVPLAELAVAVALLPAATARWAAVGALVLLTVFTMGVVNALLRGREPDCHCFGQLHSAPVGPSTLMRNGVLGLIAGFVLLGAPLRGPSGAELAALAGAALLAAACWFALHLLKQYGRVLLRLDALERELAGGNPAPSPPGLPVGLPAPSFAASDLRGEAVGLQELLAPGLPVMLVFTDPGCGPCNALLPEIAEWQRVHGAELTVALVSRGSVDHNRAASAEHGIERMLVQRDNEVADAYATQVTPSALLLSREGIVASPVALGPAAIRALLSEAVEPDAPPAPPLGGPAPPLELPDLSGDPVVLPIVPGRDTQALQSYATYGPWRWRLRSQPPSTASP
jgi:thiol-disulfide isomerase/thioredoxin